MKSILLFVYVVSSSALASEGNSTKAKPLAEAAQTMSKHLPRGCIVTAEKVGDAVVVGAAGKLEPEGTDPQHILFEIGSLTKVFTGLLLAQAIVEGRVTLDTTLEQLLPNQSFADSRVGRITLRQLATHKSGLPREPDDLHVGSDPSNPFAHYDRSRLLSFLSRAKLKGDSPFPSNYSNLGMGLLGDIIAQVYGKRWDSLVAEKITRPLGMKGTSMLLSSEQLERLSPGYRGTQSVTPWEFKAIAGAGGLKSSAADLLLFGEAILHPQNTPLQRALALMLQPQTETNGIGLAIGLYESNGQAAYGHDGLTGGHGCVFEVVPNEDAVTVIFVNNAFMNGRQVYANSRGKETRYDIPERAVLPKDLAEYEGVYLIDDTGELKKTRFTIERRGGRLYAQLSGLPYPEPFLRLCPHEKADSFFLREVDAEYRFSRQNGRVMCVTLFQYGREIEGRKTNEPVSVGSGK